MVCGGWQLLLVKHMLLVCVVEPALSHVYVLHSDTQQGADQLPDYNILLLATWHVTLCGGSLLLQGEGDSSSMHQLAHYLQQLGAQHFPDLKDAKYAEFWAHCRRHSSGGTCQHKSGAVAATDCCLLFQHASMGLQQLQQALLYSTPLHRALSCSRPCSCPERHPQL